MPIFSASMSQQTTSCPMSANPAPATSPTYPCQSHRFSSPCSLPRRRVLGSASCRSCCSRPGAPRGSARWVCARPKPLVPICGYPAIAYGLHLCARAGAAPGGHQPAPPRRADPRTWWATARRSASRCATRKRRSCSGPAAASPRRGGCSRPGRCWSSTARWWRTSSSRGVGRPSGGPRRHGGDHGGPAAASPRAFRAGHAWTRRAGWSGCAAAGQGDAPGQVADRMFTGIHILEPALLDRLPPAGVSDVIADAYQPALDGGAAHRGLDHAATSRSTPRPRATWKATWPCSGAPSCSATAPGPLTAIDPDARVHRPRHLAARAHRRRRHRRGGRPLGPDVVIGAGARVLSGARLERAVVWDGAVASGSVIDAVVTREGLVAAGG